MTNMTSSTAAPDVSAAVPTFRALTLKAARIGNTDWLVRHGFPRSSDMCAAAAEGGNVNMLTWLRHNDCEWDGTAWTAAATAGHLRVLRWLNENHCPRPAGSEPVCGAAINGHLVAATWLIDHGFPLDEVVRGAVETTGHAEIIAWLERTGTRIAAWTSPVEGAPSPDDLPSVERQALNRTTEGSEFQARILLLMQRVNLATGTIDRMACVRDVYAALGTERFDWRSLPNFSKACIAKAHQLRREQPFFGAKLLQLIGEPVDPSLPPCIRVGDRVSCTEENHRFHGVVTDRGEHMCYVAYDDGGSDYLPAWRLTLETNDAALLVEPPAAPVAPIDDGARESLPHDPPLAASTERKCPWECDACNRPRASPTADAVPPHRSSVPPRRPSTRFSPHRSSVPPPPTDEAPPVDQPPASAAPGAAWLKRASDHAAREDHLATLRWPDADKSTDDAPAVEPPAAASLKHDRANAPPCPEAPPVYAPPTNDLLADLRRQLAIGRVALEVARTRERTERSEARAHVAATRTDHQHAQLNSTARRVHADQELQLLESHERLCCVQARHDVASLVRSSGAIEIEAQHVQALDQARRYAEAMATERREIDMEVDLLRARVRVDIERDARSDRVDQMLGMQQLDARIETDTRALDHEAVRLRKDEVGLQQDRVNLERLRVRAECERLRLATECEHRETRLAAECQRLRLTAERERLERALNGPRDEF